MTIYARIDSGIVVEIIQPMMRTDEEGIFVVPPEEIPVAERFHPDFVKTLVDVTLLDPIPSDRWLAIEAGGSWTFSVPPPPQN